MTDTAPNMSPDEKPVSATPAEIPALQGRTSMRALLPLLPYALRHRLWITGAFVALAVASAATLSFPLAVRQMIDFGFTQESSGFINTTFLILLGVAGILAAASASRYYLVITLGERVVADLRSDVFAHMAGFDAAFFDTARTGELLSRLTADTTQLKSAFGSSASIALRNLFLFVGATSMMVATSLKLSGLVLVAIPVIVLPLVASGRKVRDRSRDAQDRLADASAFAAENLGAVRTMQVFGAQKITTDRFSWAVENSYIAACKATAARAWLTGTAIFLAFGSVVGVLWLGAHDVLAGRISGGLLSQFVLYALFGAGALGELSQVWSEISAAAGAATRIAALLEIRPLIAAPANPAKLAQPVRGKIKFEAISFAYPGRPDETILHQLSLNVRPGETVAIVGPSGAGKSTLFQLLLRFYDPQSGQITLDGTDIRTLDPAELRRAYALVPQDAVIFGTSIMDNIRYGSPDASEAQVRAAAQRAAADEFIQHLQDGYDTKVGERGITLSGGQRQRIAIARAILKDAPVLLLDEATSALDAENETLVQNALEGLMQNRTTLVIAHRLATILSADRILVMESGRVIEEGTHASLVKQDGLYARLARLQFENGAAALT